MVMEPALGWTAEKIPWCRGLQPSFIRCRTKGVGPKASALHELEVPLWWLKERSRPWCIEGQVGVVGGPPAIGLEGRVSLLEAPVPSLSKIFYTTFTRRKPHRK